MTTHLTLYFFKKSIYLKKFSKTCHQNHFTNDVNSKKNNSKEELQMKNKQPFSFEDIFQQNERRIHYHIQRLDIRDSHKDFFQEGLIALWDAYENYEPDQGPMATYFNFTIRNRLIDKIRKEARHTNNNEKVVMEHKTQLNGGNHFKTNETIYPLVDKTEIPIEDSYFWKNLKNNLTDNQWKWVYYYIIKDMSIKEIAELEKKSEDAIKSWGRQARKNLRNKDLQKKLAIDHYY